MLENSTIAAVATPPGEGGIAVVRLSGPESFRVAEQVFRPMDRRKQVAQARGYTALYGQFADGEERFDDGIALFFRAPHSYTGEDVVELSCHGGNAVARRPGNLERTFFQQVPSSTWYFRPRLLYAGRSSDRSVHTVGRGHRPVDGSPRTIQKIISGRSLNDWR